MDTQNILDIVTETRELPYRYLQCKVTPAIAKKWLEKNIEYNRPVKPTVVARYAEVLVAGKWYELSPEAVCFTVAGKMINGGHRLTAIVQSGVTVWLTVCVGVPEEAYRYFDQGVKRSGSDTLASDGVKNYKLVSDVVSLIIRARRNNYNLNCGKKHDNSEVHEEYFSRPDYYQRLALNALSMSNSMQRWLQPAFIGCYYHLLSEINKADAEAFFTMLCDGTGIANIKHPVSILRKIYALDKGNKKGRLNIEHRCAFFIKAWNHHRNGIERIGILKYSPEQESFPKPI